MTLVLSIIHREQGKSTLSSSSLLKRIKTLEGQGEALDHSRHTRCPTCKDQGPFPLVVECQTKEEYELVKEQPKYMCPDCRWEPSEPWRVIITYSSDQRDEELNR